MHVHHYYHHYHYHYCPPQAEDYTGPAHSRRQWRLRRARHVRQEACVELKQLKKTPLQEEVVIITQQTLSGEKLKKTTAVRATTTSLTSIS